MNPKIVLKCYENLCSPVPHSAFSTAQTDCQIPSWWGGLGAGDKNDYVDIVFVGDLMTI